MTTNRRRVSSRQASFDGHREASRQLDVLTRDIIHGMSIAPLIAPLEEDRHRQRKIRDIWRAAQQQGRQRALPPGTRRGWPTARAQGTGDPDHVRADRSGLSMLAHIGLTERHLRRTSHARTESRMHQPRRAPSRMVTSGTEDPVGGWIRWTGRIRLPRRARRRSPHPDPRPVPRSSTPGAEGCEDRTTRCGAGVRSRCAHRRRVGRRDPRHRIERLPPRGRRVPGRARPVVQGARCRPPAAHQSIAPPRR